MKTTTNIEIVFIDALNDLIYEDLEKELQKDHGNGWDDYNRNTPRVEDVEWEVHCVAEFIYKMYKENKEKEE